MIKFDLRPTADGETLFVDKTGPELLRFPLYNKGTAFTHEERRTLGIEGLLPAEFNDINQQARRIFKSIFYNHDAVGRNIGLAMLQDRNEVLFYKVLHDHLEEVMPIVYTPTVGAASRYYSRVFRRGRGLFITPDFKGRIEQVMRNAAPFSDVRLMVVTDNEAILGIGDQGAGGMAISVGKLALYCAGAGIHPAQTLPVSLDVGTNNEDLLADPQYLGYRAKRLTGDAYDELVEEFVTACKAVFPNVVIQWEDFRKDNALNILDRYKHTIPSFNDDIQGTGAVAAACLKAGCRIGGQKFTDSRIVIYGAGAAGLGIARQIRQQLAVAGLDPAQQTAAVLVMDSRGVLSDGRDNLDSYKKELAWPRQSIEDLPLAESERGDLAQVILAYGATALIGASGQAGAFDEKVVAAMSENTKRPIILPMSNPTSISEATPQDVYNWSNGQALMATGSPFDPVDTASGRQPVGQANNVFVFPGIGLGAIVANATEVTDSMISASASALADCLTAADVAANRLIPDVSRLWDVCEKVAVAVAMQSRADGVGAIGLTDTAIVERVSNARWLPRYPAIKCQTES